MENNWRIKLNIYAFLYETRYVCKFNSLSISYFSDAANSNNDFSNDVIVPPYPILQYSLEPRIPESPLNEGSRYFWHCQGNITDKSPVLVYWMKDNSLLNADPSDPHLSTYIEETRTSELTGDLRNKFYVFRNGTLRIDDVATDVAGQYQCIVTNKRGGLLISNSRKVTVLGK